LILGFCLGIKDISFSDLVRRPYLDSQLITHAIELKYHIKEV